MGEVVTGPGRELEPALQVKERNRAMLELLADNALRREPEPVTIEAQRAFEVVDADGEDVDPSFHDRPRYESVTERILRSRPSRSAAVRFKA